MPIIPYLDLEKTVLGALAALVELVTKPSKRFSVAELPGIMMMGDSLEL